MLGKLISALRNLLAMGATGRRWAPGASDLAYSTGLPIAVCDAALRFLGGDLAPFVLAHRRAEIEAVIGDTLTGSELEIAFAEVLFEDPAPGCEVKPHRGFNFPDFYDMRGTPRWQVIAVVATQEQAEALAASGSPRWQWSIVQRQVGGAAGAGA